MEENYRELEEMREQISVLKEKLAKETIISDRLLRESTKTKLFGIQRRAILQITAALMAAPFCFWAFSMNNHSLAFCIATSVMILFCAVMTVLMHARISTRTASNGSLVECLIQVKKLKKQYVDWYKIAIPMILLWMSWLVAETLMMNSDKFTAIILVISMVIGAIVGGTIGFTIHKKVIDDCDDIIASIEEK